MVHLFELEQVQAIVRDLDRRLEELGQPGGHRDRERATAQRATRVSAAASGDCRSAQGHKPLGLGSAGRSQCAGLVRFRAVRCTNGRHTRRARRHITWPGARHRRDRIRPVQFEYRRACSTASSKGRACDRGASAEQEARAQNRGGQPSKVAAPSTNPGCRPPSEGFCLSG